MKKILGIFMLLVVVCVVTTLLNPKFLDAYNVQNTVRWTALFGIISIGVSFVIISGGIDLSIGSTVGLIGTLLAWLLTIKHYSVPAALLIVFLVSVLIGLSHGLLITKLRLQPFVVTLCGLLLYRGIARYMTNDETLGFGASFDKLRYLSVGHPLSLPLPGGNILVPMPFVLMVAIAIAAAILLNQTIYGRYLLALGRNEQAARFSGIRTNRIIMMA